MARERARPGAGLLLVGAVIGGIAGGALGASLAGRVDIPGAGLPDRVTTGALPTAPPLPSGSAAPDTVRGVADVARAVGPAVVTVVQRSASGRSTGGTGSGFVIDAQRGYIATNSHVVSLPNDAPAPAFDVVFSDGRTVRGQLVGRDPDTDIAVLRVPTGGLSLTPATLGDSDQVPIGAAVVAIGSALGEFTNSVTSGVLSGKGRRFESDARRGIFLEDLVQTDAAISPGNSGGPLIWAATGQVIGMNTLVVRQPGSEGLGFAVSSNTVRGIAEELIANGRVERGRIGIAYAIIPPGAGPSIDLPADVYGVLVQEVQPGSAGAEAGLRAGDVVTKVDGQSIDLERPLPTIMLRYRPGDRVTLSVFRDGSEQRIGVTLGR